MLFLVEKVRILKKLLVNWSPTFIGKKCAIVGGWVTTCVWIFANSVFLGKSLSNFNLEIWFWLGQMFFHGKNGPNLSNFEKKIVSKLPYLYDKF